MVSVSDFFALFDNQQEFMSLAPSAAFGYLYYLSGRDQFILFAMVSLVFGSMSLSYMLNEDKISSRMNGEQESVFYFFFSMPNSFIAFPLAMIAMWNNIVSSGLRIPFPVSLSGNWGTEVVFEKSVADGDLLLLILFFATTTYTLLVVIPVAIQGLTSCVLKISPNS